jgi:hypothetical protein
MKNKIWKKEIQVSIDADDIQAKAKWVRVAYPINGVSYVFGASLARALLSVGLVRPGRPVSKDAPSLPLLRSIEASFKKCPLPQSRVFSAVISHTETPDLFFVNPAAKETELLDIQQKIQTFYRSPKAENLKVYNTWEDMPVIAPFAVDGCLYRAVVVESPNQADPRKKDSVVVKFVDYGNKETIHKKDLYYVTEEFMKLEEMAIPASLGEIEPLNSKVWSSNATKFFKSIQDIGTNEKKLMVVKVLDKVIDTGTKQLDRIIVDLYKWTESSSRGVSINNEMVQNRYARKTKIERGGDPDEGGPQVLAEFANENFSAHKILQGIHQRNKTAEFLPRDCLIPCNVMHISSPSSFYIHLGDKTVKAYYAGMIQLLEETMNKVSKSNTRSLTGETNIFNEKEPVAISYAGCWLRGVVRRKISDGEFVTPDTTLSNEQSTTTGDGQEASPNANLITKDPKAFKYEIFTIDIGFTITVPSISVFILPKKFCKDSPFAIHCCLSGIIPAGGSTWSQDSIRAIKNFTSEHKEKLFILLKSDSIPCDSVNNPVSVDIVALDTELTGPFSPPKKTYKCLADLMTGEMGVALEKRRPRGEIVNTSDTELLNNSLRRVNRGVKIHVVSDSSPESRNLFERILIARNEAIERNIIKTDALCMYELPQDPPFAFQGLVTWVDEKGFIFCQQSVAGTPVIEDVNRAIIDVMKEGELPSMQLHDLYLHRACLAKYHADQTWNRAKIIGQSREKSSHVKICFVDFGQIEEVLLEDMKGVAIRRDIPELAIKMRLFEANINMNRFREFHDQMRELCVDKCCSFVWENAYNKDPMKVSILAPKHPEDKNEDLLDQTDVKKWLSNLDLIEEVFDFGEIPLRVTTIRECLNSCPFENNSFQDEDGFKPYQFYHLGGGVCVGNTFVYFQQRGLDSPNSSYERDVLQKQNDFLRMMNDLHIIGPSASSIGMSCKSGTPCIAMWRAFDGVYYRAVVTGELEEGEKRNVCFVDYGNTELIPANDIKEIPERHVKGPEMHCFMSKIDNIRPRQGVNWETSRLENKMEREFTRCSKTMIGYLYTKQLQNRVEVFVDLYEAESESSLRPAKHLFQGLVDRGLLEFVDLAKKDSVIRTKRPFIPHN